MKVTGRNVVLGGVNVGTTWTCERPDCEGNILLMSGPFSSGGTRKQGYWLKKAREREEAKQ